MNGSTHALAVSSLVFCLCTGCGASESAVATAVAETERARALKALALTATAAAQATDTPSPTATSTMTPTATDTPQPSPTPTPPPGMAYVPDLIGLDLPDAEEILNELGCRWFYVAVINTEVPEWQVVDQEPEPGSLIDLDDDRIRIFVAVAEYTPTPRPVPAPRAPEPAPNPCGDITYEGVCIDNVCYWCEDSQLWYMDCSSCGGYCGWSDTYNYFTCFCPPP